ncbi:MULTISPECIES: ATP-binding protein [unclassified Blastococcus]
MSGPGPFAERLRRLREAAALTQEELAERAGLTGKAVSALERGERRRPYPHTVRALADALGLDDAARSELAEAARPAAPAPPGPAAVLPRPPVALAGRDTDRAEVAALLRDGARLVTLTGPGGVGKTSLALDVAHAVAPDFPDGVVLVELAPLREPGLVVPTVARAVGGQQPAGPPLDGLAEVVGGRRLLLVLDNVEHVLAAAADVAALLTRCPRLVVLATSRAPLRVRAEVERPVEPLPVPAGAAVDAVAASPAARLFLDRARAAGRPVELTARSAAAVAAICRRLDGLPLALELAAAHARFLAPDALLARLDTAVAAPGARDLPARQRTVRATLDWSAALLTAEEQVLFRRLSVFAGGFTLDAAQALAGEGDVLPALAGLVEQSLVQAAGDRYRMLEPVRQYAAARLAEAGEAAGVTDRFADVLAGSVTGARTGLAGAGQAAWLDRLEAEHGNLAAALGRLLDRGRAGTAARLVADTWMYWALRGNAVEGLTWARRVTAAGGDGLDPADRTALLVAEAGLRYASGDIPGTAASGAAAVAAAREAGDDGVLALALVLTGSAAVFGGDLDAAAADLAEAVRLGRASGALLAETHAVMAEGQRLLQAGDPAGCRTALAEAEALARRLGGPFSLAAVLNMQATLAQATGDDAGALTPLTEAAELAAEVATSWGLAYTLPALAVCAAHRGRHEIAAELFAAGSATAEAASVAAAYPPDQEAARRWLPVVRAALGEEAFERAWRRGRGLRPADVPALAARISRAPG